MSQKSTETAKSYTTRCNFQVSIEGCDDDVMICIDDFIEMLKDWKQKLLITSATAATHDARLFDEVFDVIDKEDTE